MVRNALTITRPRGANRWCVLLIAVTATAYLPATAQAAGYSVVAQSSAFAGTIYVAGGANCRYGVNGQGGVCSHGTAYYGGTSAASVDQPFGSTTATHVAMSTSGSGGGAAATSSTVADLRTASIHLYGSDTGQITNCSSHAVPCGSTQESARLNDTLHFTVPGATATTVTTITGRFTLDGFMRPTGSNLDAPNTATGEIYGALSFGGVPSRFDLQNNQGTGFKTVAFLDNYPSGISPSTWTTNATHTVNVSTFTTTVTGPTGDLSFALDANLICSTGFECNYRDTAKFALTLPTGVSYTSDSGVFLKGDGTVGGVPEPASWALLVAGFGIVGAAARRRREGVVAA